MTTIEPIDLAARLTEMAGQLTKQGRDPVLSACDAIDLRAAAAEMDRLRRENVKLREAVAQTLTEIDRIRVDAMVGF